MKNGKTANYYQTSLKQFFEKKIMNFCVRNCKMNIVFVERKDRTSSCPRRNPVRLPRGLEMKTPASPTKPLSFAIFVRSRARERASSVATRAPASPCCAAAPPSTCTAWRDGSRRRPQQRHAWRAAGPCRMGHTRWRTMGQQGVPAWRRRCAAWRRRCAASPHCAASSSPCKSWFSKSCI